VFQDNGTGSRLAWQALFVTATAVMFFIIYGGFSALSAGFGGGIAMASSLLLGWRRHRADTGRALSGQASLGLLYRTAFERFGLVVLLLALGLGWLRLEPVALIAGFIAGQLALFINVTTKE
jgi:ATP synthase protein I